MDIDFFVFGHEAMSGSWLYEGENSSFSFTHESRNCSQRPYKKAFSLISVKSSFTNKI